MQILIFLIVLVVINAFLEAYTKNQNEKNDNNDKSEK
jgi:hypothetical protein